tara:strand:+ start:1005 stop:1322 length:318 start_codon:yes stop_codon:yes gene_type:complete
MFRLNKLNTMLYGLSYKKIERVIGPSDKSVLLNEFFRDKYKSDCLGGVILCLRPFGFDPGPCLEIPSELSGQLHLILRDDQLIKLVDAHPPIDVINIIKINMTYQ